MEYNRHDIMEAYVLYYCLWHIGGRTMRDRNCVSGNTIGRFYGRTYSKVRRIRDVSEYTLTENGLEIYLHLLKKWEPEGTEATEREEIKRKLNRERELTNGRR